MTHTSGEFMAPRGRWFRFYDDALDDPKVQMLSPELFKTWINCLCVASKSGGKIPTAATLGFRLRISTQDAQARTEDLILAGLIDIMPDGSMEVHKWSERQFVSDTSADRMRKFRAKRKGDVTSDVTCAGSDVTNDVPEAESDTDSELAAPLPPKGETKQQGFKNGFAGGSFSQAKREEVRELTRKRAEGFGLPVDEILAEAKQASPKNLDAYFQAICRRRLASKLPGIADEALRKAFGPDPRAMAAVCTALMEAP